MNDSAGHRLARLEGLLLEELRSLLRDDVTDPDLYGIELTALVLSVDYRHARVHYTAALSAGDVRSRRSEIERAFVRATPFLRARLAEAIDLKRVPDLRFVFDASPADASR